MTEDPYALAEAYENEIVQGVPRWRLEELGRKHADDGVIEDEHFEDEPEDEEIEDELTD